MEPAPRIDENVIRASGGMEEDGAGREPWALPASASPGPFSSSSSESDGEEDEGWAPFLAEAAYRPLEEGSEQASVFRTLASIDVQDAAFDQPTMLSCRVLRLELPVTSASFLGVEKEELVVTCHLLVGDGAGDDALDLLGANTLHSSSSAAGVPSPGASPLVSPASSPRLHRPPAGGSGLRVASTRLPSSFRPAKGHVCWDQRLDIATIRLDRLLSPAAGPARLRLMLWASTSSTLMGQVEVPLFLPPPAGQPADGDADADDGEQEEQEEEEATAPFSVLQLGIQRVAIPIFHGAARERTPPGRRGSAIEPSSSPHQARSRKRQLPPRWRRAASEPVRDEAMPSLSRLQLDDEEAGAAAEVDDYVPRPFAWPAQGQLVIDVALLSTRGADERKEKASAATSSEASPLALAQALLAHPCDLLRREEAAVLWAQRQGLAQDGRALVKLLRALLAYGPFEEGTGGHAGSVLAMWAAAGCTLSILDAMKLMGRHFSDPAIRGFALRQLERAGDGVLEFHLLQLVQLLRYEPWAEARGGGSGGGGAAGAAEEPLQSMNMPPLARFLIDRACGSLALGNALFWFLTAEMQTDRVLGRTFESVRFAFLYTLNERDALAYAALSAQEGWLKRIFKAYQRVLDAPGLRERKQTMLRELLAEDGLARPALPSVPLPLDSSLRTTGLDATTACVYGSKTYPAFLAFALEAGAGSTAPCPPEEATEQDARPNDEKVLIFKMREDLRQDQLVLQLIRLMDGLLKARGLDLCLTPYRVLATGQQEGIVEYVPGAVTIADVMAATRYSSSSSSTTTTTTITTTTSSGGTGSRILAFFQHHRPSPSDPLGVEPAVLDTYIRSLAGYCVATHLLGVGDRHLHNIMLCPTGRLFHLDFGFILGRDPKPVPRGPFRLSPAMIDGMGGREHPNFAAFKRLCVQAFACLRGHARLLLGLLDLMVDANIKDLSPNPTPLATVSAAAITTVSTPTVERAQSLTGSLGLGQAAATQPQPPPPPQQHPDAARVLARMERRFRLDLGDDEGAIEQHFVGLIHKALGALGPQVVEVLHNLAVIAK